QSPARTQSGADRACGGPGRAGRRARTTGRSDAALSRLVAPRVLEAAPLSVRELLPRELRPPGARTQDRASRLSAAPLTREWIALGEPAPDRDPGQPALVPSSRGERRRHRADGSAARRSGDLRAEPARD